MFRTGLFVAIAVAAACLLAAETGMAQGVLSDDAVTKLPDPVPQLLKSPADVARGRSIFVGTCGAYCHKMAPGPGDAPFLFDCDWLFGGSDAEIFHTVTHGVAGSRMVPFEGAIPDADIWRVVAYLKSASQCKK